MSKDSENNNPEQRDTAQPPLSDKELARRKMLRKAALGTGAAITAPVWIRPVINTVVLPAHAQTSRPNITTLSPTSTSSSISTSTSSSITTSSSTITSPTTLPF